MKQQVSAIFLIAVTVVAVGGVAGAGIIFINYHGLNGNFRILAHDYEELLAAYQELLSNYSILSSEYDALLTDFNNLQADYNTLNATYHALLVDYTTLLDAYNTLQANYDDLVLAYDSLWNSYSTLASWICGQVLPVQVFTFAESIRRYYLPLYLNVSSSLYWANYSEFMADIVRHATPNITSFEKWNDVRNAYIDILRYGNNTPQLSDYVLSNIFDTNTTHDWYWGYDRNWDVLGLHPFMTDEIHDWVLNALDYEDDDIITQNREYSEWDYIKFPVETIFRGLGDSEDQAIFEAAYLRSCGFEVAVGSFHDDAHPTLGSLNHSVLWLNIDYNGDGVVSDEECMSNHWWYKWSLDGSPETWIILYPSLDEQFGDYPDWFLDYIIAGITDFTGRLTYVIV